VDRDADGAGLVGDGAGDGLPDPPRGVGGELVAAAVFEFVDRLHQADVAFLDQVEELQAAVRVLLGDRDDEAEVGLDHLGLGLMCFAHVHVGAIREFHAGRLGDALAGLDRLEAGVNDLRVDRCILLGPRVLGALEEIPAVPESPSAADGYPQGTPRRP
jgi:hypothetical protein